MIGRLLGYCGACGRRVLPEPAADERPLAEIYAQDAARERNLAWPRPVVLGVLWVIAVAAGLAVTVLAVAL